MFFRRSSRSIPRPYWLRPLIYSPCFFFFNDTATTEIYTLSLHDALPISGLDDREGEQHAGDRRERGRQEADVQGEREGRPGDRRPRRHRRGPRRDPDESQPGTDRKSTRLNSSHTVISYAVFCLKKKENTSELQSHSDLVCRLLLEKKSLLDRCRVIPGSNQAVSGANTIQSQFALVRNESLSHVLDFFHENPILSPLSSASPYVRRSHSLLTPTSTFTDSDFLFFLMIRRPPRSTLFPFTTLFLFFLKSTRPTSIPPFTSHAVFRF